MNYFDKEIIEESVIDVEVEGNKFKCIHCGKWHELSDEGWKTDEDFLAVPIKTFICTKNVYYIFYKDRDNYGNLVIGYDYIQLQDGDND